MTNVKLYELLHSYNTTGISYSVFYNRKSDNALIRTVHVDFLSKDEAEDARQRYNGYNWNGYVLGVAPWQIPMKHLGVSWDSGRGQKGVHFSERDQGSAADTNFEEVY